MLTPNVDIENSMYEEGAKTVAGVDEVGRGSWAGPLSVGVVVLNISKKLPKLLRDSKMLSEKQRVTVFEEVRDCTIASAVGHASASECDEYGMVIAQRKAAQRGFDQLGLVPDCILLDGPYNFCPTDLGSKTKCIVRGDAICASIAAASVVAKVTRDQIMINEAPNYPPFDFHLNKGYPSPTHKIALCGWGLTPIHRRSWSFVERIPWSTTV